jgi:hypothetical protein
VDVAGVDVDAGVVVVMVWVGAFGRVVVAFAQDAPASGLDVVVFDRDVEAAGHPVAFPVDVFCDQDGPFACAPPRGGADPADGVGVEDGGR